MTRKTMQSAWTYPVMPEEAPGYWEKETKPIRREELPEEFTTVCFRCFEIDENNYIRNYEEDLGLYQKLELGKIIWPHPSFVKARNFKKVIDYIADKTDLYIFDIWGYVPGFIAFKGYPNFIYPREQHDYMLAKLGRRFLGWDFGEQEGRCSERVKEKCPAPVRKADAHRIFDAYFKRMGDEFFNYVTCLSSLPLVSHVPRLGALLLLGAETAQGLPSVPMWYTFLRGASKQHRILLYGNASVYNRFGGKWYHVKGTILFDGLYVPKGFKYGPKHGTSESLLRRLMYIEYLYGSVFTGIETSQIVGDDNGERIMRPDRNGDKSIMPAPLYRKKPELAVLSPAGKIQVEAMKWCQRHHDPGVQFTPALLLLDEHTGWIPARQLYSDQAFVAWGNMDYTEGDHQIDVFFREVFPGYEDGSYYKDERGFLTPTPCGDIFDVLLTDADDEILAQYNAIITLGDIRVSGKTFEKVHDFVMRGGKLITFANQLGADTLLSFGVTLGEKISVKAGDSTRTGKKRFKEKAYSYIPVSRDKCRVLIENRQGDALAISFNYGRGEVLIFAPGFGLTDRLREDQTYFKNHRPLTRSFDMLESVKHILKNYLGDLNLIEVKGNIDIQFITNVGKNTNRLVISLSNPGYEKWQGTVRVKSGKVKTARDILNEEDVKVKDETLFTSLNGRDLRIIDIRTDSPCFQKKPKGKVPSITPSDSRLGTISWFAPDIPIMQAVDIAAETGFQHIQPDGYILSRMTESELDDLRENIESRRMYVSAVNLATHLNRFMELSLNNSNEWEVEAVRKFFDRCVKASIRVGSKRLILSHSKVEDAGQTYEEAIEQGRLNLQYLLSLAEPKGIRCLLELNPYRLIKNSEEFVKFVDSFKGRIGIAMNTGHQIMAGETPVTSANIYGSRLEYVNLCNNFDIKKHPVIDRHLPLDAKNGVMDSKKLRALADHLRDIHFKGEVALSAVVVEDYRRMLETGRWLWGRANKGNG